MKRQWLVVVAVGLAAMGPPPPAVPSGVSLITFECGPGYHKPAHGQCVPDAGRPLLRFNRYPVFDRGVAPSIRAPGTSLPVKLTRPAAPWR